MVGRTTFGKRESWVTSSTKTSRMKVRTIIFEPGWNTVSISMFFRLMFRNSCSESQRRALKALRRRERLTKTWPESSDDGAKGLHWRTLESSDFDFLIIGLTSST